MDDQLLSYYGHPSTYNNASYGSCMFFNVWNTDFAIIDFQSDDEAEQWQKGYKDIKRAEDWVVMHIEANHVSLTEKRTLFANEFLPVTVTFLEKWGLEYVPADLRFSINDVRINVGLPLISWPVIPHIDGNGVLQTPSVTDDFGQGI